MRLIIPEQYGFKGFKKLKTRQDKGHAEQFRLFAERIRTGGEPLIPLEEILNVAEASLAAVESLVNGEWVNVGIGFSREGTQRAQKEREGEPEPLKVSTANLR